MISIFRVIYEMALLSGLRNIIRVGTRVIVNFIKLAIRDLFKKIKIRLV